MKIKDLIEKLKKLDEDKTISMLNLSDLKIEEISIKSNRELNQQEIDCIGARRSNKEKETDYYIVLKIRH